MIRALFSAASGMISQQLNIDTVANNLANVTTTGFKKSRANFQDLLYETIRAAGGETASGTIVPEGIQVGHGVRPISITKLFSQGSLIMSGEELDVAIQGDGFFQVSLPDGTTAYTRDGSFAMGPDGEMLTSDGYPIEPSITIPEDATEIYIGPDGIVSAQVPGQAAPQQLGQIQLANFVNPAGLDARLGRNLLLESEASGTPQIANPTEEGLGSLAHKYLENSNVQVVEEILRMIVAQRAYEANSKVIQTSDDMLQVANNVKR